MLDLFTLENLFNLGMLIFLQAVLGFDNLLYISIESQRAPKESQASVRRNGILIAVALRIVLLFTMIQLIAALNEPFFVMDIPGIIEGGVNFSTIVFVLGGAFIMYTAVKEIKHLLELHDPEHAQKAEPKSARAVIAMIVLMNLIFSFDSILSAHCDHRCLRDPRDAADRAVGAIAMLVLADTGFGVPREEPEIRGTWPLHPADRRRGPVGRSGSRGRCRAPDALRIRGRGDVEERHSTSRSWCW